MYVHTMAAAGGSAWVHKSLALQARLGGLDGSTKMWVQLLVMQFQMGQTKRTFIGANCNETCVGTYAYAAMRTH